MYCSNCGTDVGDPPPRFCPNCGRALAAATPDPGGPATPGPPASPPPQVPGPPPPDVEPPAEASGPGWAETQARVRVAADSLLERVPGRSLVLLGAALVVAAVVLGWTPLRVGVGVLWTILMLLAAAATILHELVLVGGVGRVQGRARALISSPLVPAVLAAFTWAHAIQKLSLRVVPLLWLLAAILLAVGLYRRHRASHLEATLVARGNPRALVAGGALFGIATMFLDWDSVRYSYFSYYSYYSYYYASYGFEGRAMPAAIYALAALTALVVIPFVRPWQPAGGRRGLLSWRNVVLALAGYLTLWWFVGVGDRFGGWVFLLGLVAIDAGAVLILRASRPRPPASETPPQGAYPPPPVPPHAAYPPPPVPPSPGASPPSAGSYPPQAPAPPPPPPETQPPQHGGPPPA